MELIQAFILGLTLGAGTLLFIGPVLFYLIKSTIESGQKAGFMVALGIIVGDIIYVLIVMNGLSDYLESPLAHQYLAIIGGGLLVFFGAKPFLTKSKIDSIDAPSKKPHLLHYFTNGFVINFVNPFVITVWIGFFMLCDVQLPTNQHTGLALVTCLSFIFATDLIKVMASMHLKKFLTPKRLLLTSKIFGTIMLLFGLRLIYVGLMT